MKQNHNLFELIKSMDRNERRYFRLFASMQKGNKHYIELFDAIDSQTEYDEKLIRKNISNQKLKRNFAYTKNYLRKIIFRSLEAYNADSSVDMKIQSMIVQCKILFRKTLYRQYFDTLEKAKRMALRYERFGYWLELVEMGKMIIPKREVNSFDDESLYNEAIGIINKARNNLEYSRIIKKFHVIYRDIGTSRMPEHKEIIEKVLSEECMKSSLNALSSKAKMTYLRINEIIERIKANHDSAVDFVNGQISLAESNPGPFEDFIIDFKTEAVCSLVSLNLKRNKLIEASKGIESLKSLKQKDLSEKISFEISTVFLELEFCLAGGGNDKLSSIIEKLEQLLVKYKDKIELDFELMANFKIIAGFIKLEEFDKALRKANYLLSHQLLAKRPDIEYYTRILFLIIHYELDSFALLPYLIRSTYRYLLKTKKLYRLESLIISFLRKLSGVKSDDDLQFNLNTLRKEMIVLSNDKFEKNAFEYFDFLGWIEKRLKIKRKIATGI